MGISHVRADQPADALAEALAAALESDGAVIVDGLLDADLLDRFNGELDPLLEAARPDHGRYVNDGVAAFFGDRTRHVLGVAGKSEIFATEVLTHPVYRAACDRVLLPNCARYRLNIAHVMDRGPGSVRQWPHRDEMVWNHVPVPHPELQLASVIALVDFTADNGATVVAPGSHRWDDPRRMPTEDEWVAAEMPAGSAVIYLGSTIHAGGSNATDGWRRGMHVSYCLGWLRTEENQFLAVPLEVARGLPRRAQELVGYAAHDAITTGGGYLGTHEVQDPVELMARGEL
jgi:ectoine hydroxylase-related dioxygenase (phytanoyl-CoA dioxygenase family)